MNQPPKLFDWLNLDTKLEDLLRDNSPADTQERIQEYQEDAVKSLKGGE